MEIHFTPEQEKRLAEIAAECGQNPEHLVREAALRLMEIDSAKHGGVSEFPILHLGAMKSLHRRDIYEDAR